MARTTRLQLQALEAREVPADLTYGFAIPGLPATANTRIAADSLGNTYVTGTFSGTIDVDPSPTTQANLIGKGGTDVFVAKYSPTGQLMWAKILGGEANETAADIVFDGIGNVYVAGTFTGAVDFNPDPTISSTLTAAAGGSAFLWKLSSIGNFFMARSVGGTSTATGLTVNPAGQILVTGQFTGTADFNPLPTATANLVTTNTTGSAYVWRLNVGGGYSFAKAFNTSGTIKTTAIAMDAVGHAYLAGQFTGTADLDPADATKANFAAGTNWMPFVTKLGPTGNYMWGRTIRTVSAVTDAPNAITGLGLDGIGNIYAAGTFAGTLDFNPAAANWNLTSASANADGFLWKLDNSGSMLHALRFGGSNAETVSEIGVDLSGNSYITGTFTGIADFDPNPASTAVAKLVSGSGEADSYLLKIGKLGLMKYARTLGGGNSTTKVTGIWADGAGNMYVTGSMVGKGDIEPGPLVTPMAGGSGSAFVAKLSPSVAAPPKPINTPPTQRSAGGPYSIGEGDGITVKATANDADPDLLSFSWDLNGDGVFGDAVGNQASLTRPQLKALGLVDGTTGTRTIKVRIGDGVNLPVDATATLTIANLPPTATLDGPNKTAEGVRPTITVAASDPSPTDRQAGLRYSYDFNDDGVWDMGDGTTYAGSVTTGSVKVPAIWVTDSGPLAIRVKVFDKDGASTTATKLLEVINAPPTATFGPTAPVKVGVPATFKFTNVNDAADDKAVGFTYGFDFDNDGVFEVSGASPQATQVFASSGPFVVRGSITDQDGGRTVYALTVNVLLF